MTTTLQNELIKTVDDLHYYLKQAMAIEHATLPPYITALYSMKPGTNIEAFHILRAVAVEEMLHLTLAANVFNAVGGDIKSVLTDPDFIPQYPTTLPTGETDFEVGLNKFSRETVRTFLKIERANEAERGQPLVVPRNHTNSLLTVHNHPPHFSFYSIGQFYAEIIRGLHALHKELGDDLFCGDPAKQVTPEYYYNGGGEIIPVTNLTSAIRALREIQEQGEGSGKERIYDGDRELSHYYRFQQLLLNEDGDENYGQYYVIDREDPEKSDKPGHPTGDKFKVDWDAVYPIKENIKLNDFTTGSEVYEAAKKFQSDYAKFMKQLESAFNGHPQVLIPAVGAMCGLKYQAERLVKNSLTDSDGVHAAPVYRLD
ncbi:MAG: ferritin-like protein [Pleurocapsa sp. MO_226.B13]|nr:ferritin-like protein [Pleurocapsa sp. MO_226.B13]